MTIITILTDFGLKDPYVGAMKGVMLSINGDARIVDITHEIEAQDVREAAFVVAGYYSYFPEGTIHVAVVDPTVGSTRRPVVFVRGGHFFVGPDNGLFSLATDAATECYMIESRDYQLPFVSATFQGRDIFAPAAAHLSLGVDPALFGRRITDPVMLEGVHPVVAGDRLSGAIVRLDRFGNAISNISAHDLRSFAGNRAFTVAVAGRTFSTLSRSYYEAEFTCLIGSSGHIEFGRFRGSFAEKCGVKKGEAVIVERR